MGLIKKKRCRNCGELFIPDYRNRERQKYCDKAACKKASKTASQEKWLKKPENENYFHGPENIQRVREWRKSNPGYGKRSPLKSPQPLQDTCEPEQAENIDDNTHFANNALQDLCELQPSVIVGLIALFTGSSLQDNIEETFLRVQQLGQDILSFNPESNGGKNYDCKVCDLSGSVAKNSQEFHLD